MRLLIIVLCLAATILYAADINIATEQLRPGVTLAFSSDIRQDLPYLLPFQKSEMQVYLEAHAYWKDYDTPEGVFTGTFVPYLSITATLRNQDTGLSSSVTLLPHMSLSDSLHYARHIALPGTIDDVYELIFTVIPPTADTLVLHSDWANAYGPALIGSRVFHYPDMQFSDTAMLHSR